MSGGPRTARDALIAELLGDVDTALTRVEVATKAIDDVRAAAVGEFEKVAGKAAQDLDAATTRFGSVTTQNVDEFVAVANEALAKFAARTNELKATIEQAALTQAPVPAVPVATHAASLAVASVQWIWVMIPIAFALGIVLGVLLPK